MSFGQAIADFYKGYVVFKGRTSRTGYWLAILFFALVLGVITILEGQPISPITGEPDDGPIANVWGLVNLVPLIAIGIRRMHDLGKSGWLILVPVYNFILYCTAGNTTENQYGAPVK
jgi:uncharacterized membrane protein YhaH (DUF805 family)